MYGRVIVVLTCLIASTVSGEKEQPRIVIVGAGASGIAAASKLLQNGFENVLILEAEDRIGGRVHTIQFGGYAVDMGAQWIHGEKNNAVYEIVLPMNLTDHSDDTDDDVYTSKGELFDPVISKNITDTYVHYLEDITEISGDECQRSVGECFETKLTNHFKLFPEINDTMKEELLWLFGIMHTALDPADNWYDVAAKEFQEYEMCDGDNSINWKERGYSTMLDILMKKFPNPEEELPVLNKTILNAEVTKVDYSNEDNTVKLQTQDGKEYIADHVIMTPSLGVLKAQYETLFTPSLPEEKIKNIKAIGFGNACKIYVAYNDSWFNPRGTKTGGFRILWSKEDRKILDSNPKTKWMPYTVGFFFVEHKPHIMYAWISGKGARLMDDLTDEEVFEQTEQMLSNMLSKNLNVSKPVEMIRTKWHQNKHFCGAYSYHSMETVKMNASAMQLAEPIMKMEKPVILFGGEATNKNQFSTVHGAIGTGWREADRLIDLYKSKEESTEKSTV